MTGSVSIAAMGLNCLQQQALGCRSTRKLQQRGLGLRNCERLSAQLVCPAAAWQQAQ